MSPRSPNKDGISSTFAGFTPRAALRSMGAALVGEQDRWVLWTPVILGIGIGLYFALPSEPPLWLGPMALMAAAGARWMGRQHMALSLLAVALGLAALGFTVTQWRTALVASPMLEERIGPTQVTGRILNLETLPNGTRATLEKPRIAALAPEKTPDRLRITLKGTQPDMAPGDWVTLRAQLIPPPPPAAPGAFDFQRQSFFRGLGGVGWSLGAARITAQATGRGIEAPMLAVADLRRRITTRILHALPRPEGAVAAALMTGERRSVPPDLMDEIRDSGLAHLLAISGLHIGLVAGTLFFSLRALLALAPAIALRYPIKKWAAAVAIVGAFAYALLAGATVPTQRAFLMVGLILAAVLVDRRGISMRLVAWAALIILLLQPESLLGASFQMSFAAVVALVAAYESQRGRLGSRGELGAGGRLALYLGGVALTTVIASAATAPFAIHHFNRLAVFGLAANMVAVPVTALWVMPWAVLAFLLMPLGLESLALIPMGWGIDVVTTVAGTVAAWPGSVTVLPAMPDWALASIALGGVWLCLWRRRWRIWGVAGITAGMMAIPLVRPPDVLVDGRARLVAVRDAGGNLAVSSLTRARFERDIWLRRVGADQAIGWPDLSAKEGGDRQLVCDSLGCIYHAEGRNIALVKAPDALLEDCGATQALISLVPTRRTCFGPAVVIDRFDLWRDGAHALWIEPDGRIRAESVNETRGDRPWVIRPSPKKSEKPHFSRFTNP